jgi:hypothetical protein
MTLLHRPRHKSPGAGASSSPVLDDPPVEAPAPVSIGSFDVHAERALHLSWRAQMRRELSQEALDAQAPAWDAGPPDAADDDPGDWVYERRYADPDWWIGESIGIGRLLERADAAHLENMLVAPPRVIA